MFDNFVVVTGIPIYISTNATAWKFRWGVFQILEAESMMNIWINQGYIGETLSVPFWNASQYWHVFVYCICLAVCLLVHLCIYLFVCMSACLFVCLAKYLFPLFSILVIALISQHSHHQKPQILNTGAVSTLEPFDHRCFCWRWHLACRNGAMIPIRALLLQQCDSWGWDGGMGRVTNVEAGIDVIFDVL